MKNVWKESWALVFKRGNIWALAIGVLVGGAFGVVVNSLANDVIMQAIAKAGGVKGIESLAWGVTQWNHETVNGISVQTTPIDGIKYGKLLSAIIALLIMVFFLVLCTFISLLIWRSIKKRKEAKAAALIASQPVVEAVVEPTTEELILEELRKLNANSSFRSTAKKPAAKKTSAPAKKTAKKSK